MSAIDRIEDRKTKKYNFRDRRWRAVKGSGSFDHTLYMGDELVGQVDWTYSRYLKVGNDLCFFAFVGDRYLVLDEKKREGYVPPPEIKWGMPLAGRDDE